MEFEENVGSTLTSSPQYLPGSFHLRVLEDRDLNSKCSSREVRVGSRRRRPGGRKFLSLTHRLLVEEYEIWRGTLAGPTLSEAPRARNQGRDRMALMACHQTRGGGQGVNRGRRVA